MFYLGCPIDEVSSSRWHSSVTSAVTIQFLFYCWQSCVWRLAVKCHFPLQGDFTKATVSFDVLVSVEYHRFVINSSQTKQIFCIFACFVFTSESPSAQKCHLKSEFNTVCTSTILFHHEFGKAIMVQWGTYTTCTPYTELGLFSEAADILNFFFF